MTASTSSRINRGWFATKTRTRFTSVILAKYFYFVVRESTRLNYVPNSIFRGSLRVPLCTISVVLLVALVEDKAAPKKPQT